AVPNTVAEDDFCATVYHGYLAISDDVKAAMQALKVAGEKLYKPSDEARKLMENSQAFAHLNPAVWLDAFKKELAEARQELSTTIEDGLQDEDKMADAPAFVKRMDKEALKDFVTDGYDLCLALLADIESVDVALGFDMRGLKLSSIMSVTKDGLLSRYMLPSNGIEKLEPPLPALDMFYMAAWGKLDEKLVETLLADWQKVFARTLVLFPAEPDGAQPDEALDFLKKFDDVIKEGLPLMGGRFAAVGNFSENGPGIIQVQEVKDPEKLRALTAKGITIINELLASIVPKDDDVNISMKYVYEPEAVTIEGVKADRFKFEVKADTPEAQAQIDQTMTMYGPDGLGYLIAAVDGKVVTTMGEENMKLALRALRGVASVELINTDPVIRSTVKKIGLDRDVISMFVPARVIEFFGLMMARMTGQEGNAPMPLPFATPAALGMKVLDESTLRCDGYVPQACVAECMTAVMGLTGMMGGFFGGQMNVPPPGVVAPAAVPPAPPPNDAPMW
ncbi:MAG: hypothetical protein HQ592_16125, partial [Planctomycetes bacterium]|nr:hypothetical protein [Planctomycetota bacterium]